MAGIWNVNSLYNSVDAKKLISKLSFEIGEVFLARVINLDEGNSEVLLRMMEGWQFPAKLKIPLDYQPSGNIRFKVNGFEEGKILLEILNNRQSDENLSEDSIEYILKQQNIKINKEDYPLLQKMIKYNMPLTKDNIIKVKTITDFINRINKDPSYEEQFIDKYLDNRGYDINSQEYKNTKQILKGFFGELKNITEDDLLTFFENDVELSEENIKSFNKVFKGSKVVFNSLDKLKRLMENESSNNMLNNTEVLEGEGNEVLNTLEKISDKNKIKDNNILIKREERIINLKDNLGEETLKLKLETTKGNSQVGQDYEKLSVNIKELDKDTDKIVLNSKKNYFEDISTSVKKEISCKNEDMKNTIKEFLQKKEEFIPEIFDRLIQVIKKDISNFKIFNTVSNQYYYLDVPIDIKDSMYDCKLIIKDERRKGKKIDSKNAKIATSIKTLNMGVVDGFISVNNMKMDIKIKCDRRWMKILDYGKDNILNSLDDTGYNISISIEEREEEVSLTGCRDFFQDNDITTLNVMV
ncbi:hypothetical protein [Clostridium rectalis]|uniref:hypothetical protein n=1 Tax=Clostridium rectalis TaxID=2040295 RepID=UPI000F631584|nr:hypothetical protein [Clostridium rectalis]